MILLPSARRPPIRPRTLLATTLFVLSLATAAESWAHSGEDQETATLAPLASRSLLLDVGRLDGAVIAVGDRGHILRSPDGTTWSQVVAPTRRMLCAVATVQPSLAWVVGHDGLILHSDDAGDTWSIQHLAPEEESPLFDVWFESATRGVAVGAYGLYLETDDAGATWDPRVVDENEPHFFSLAPAADGTLYLGGEFGTLLRSDDGGATWTPLSPDYRGSFFGVLPTASGAVLGFGLRGNVFRSTDRGETFARVSTPTTAGLLGGTQLADGSIVLVGLSGAIMVSGDDGQSFVSRDREDRMGISGVLELPGGLLGVGEFGAVPIRAVGD